MIYFILGIILGLLIRDIKFTVVKKVDDIKERYEESKQHPAQFFEPITLKEKFNSATSVDDLLDK